MGGDLAQLLSCLQSVELLVAGFLLDEAAPRGERVLAEAEQVVGGHLLANFEEGVVLTGGRVPSVQERLSLGID